MMKNRTFIRNIVLVAFIAAIITGITITLIKNDLPRGRNITEVKEFLSDYGVITAGEGEAKNIVIPEVFGEVYENYNTLQKEQGFDLSDYRGREAVSYSLPVVSVKGKIAENTDAHVIVCDGYIIGGDVASRALGGEMTGIR